MRTVAYLRWNPPSSSLRVEFPSALLGELEQDSGGQGWGVLYGTRHAAELRLLAARRQPDDSDPRLATLAVAGLYFCRARGDIFLTEADLEKFLVSGVDLCLVVCGQRAGFFIREADGSVESLRSHEEFNLPQVRNTPPKKAARKLKAPAAPVHTQYADLPKPAPRKVLPARPAPYPSARGGFEWGWATAAVFLVLAIPLGAMAYLSPMLPHSLQLSVSEFEGQLVVYWNPLAAVEDGKLEILDGSSTLITDIQAGQHSATYQPHSGSITVALRSNSNRSRYFRQSLTYYVRGPLPLPPPRSSANPEELQTLEEQVNQLKSELASRQERMESLQAGIRKLMDRIHANPGLIRR